MRPVLLTTCMLGLLAACTPPEVPEETGPEPVPLNVTLSTE